MGYGKKTRRITAALIMCGLMGIMLAAGCGTQDGTGGAGGAADAFASVDPTQAETAQMTAEYAVYLLEMMIQQNVSDPSTVDDATLQALADQYAPSATASAQQWAQGLDPSTIPLFSVDPDKVNMCVNTFGCNPVEACPFSKLCWLVNCGAANCSQCPTNWQPNKLLFTGWCAHVCLGSGAPPPVVGYKAVIHFRGGLTWSYCYQVANNN